MTSMFSGVGRVLLGRKRACNVTTAWEMAFVRAFKLVFIDLWRFDSVMHDTDENLYQQRQALVALDPDKALLLADWAGSPAIKAFFKATLTTTPSPPTIHSHFILTLLYIHIHPTQQQAIPLAHQSTLLQETVCTG
jgi:hypothetical protein